MAAPGISTGTLVPSLCVKCPRWTEVTVRTHGSRVHLFALREAGDPQARLLLDALQEATAAARAGNASGGELELAVGHLRDAHALIQGSPEHRKALAPAFEDRLARLMKRFLRHPEEFFALVGCQPPAPVSDAAWAHYLKTLRGRAMAEEGIFEKSPNGISLSARGVWMRIGRDVIPDTDDSEIPVLVAGLGQVGPLASKGGTRVVVVHPETALHKVVAPAEAPPWIVRLLDPRPTPLLVAEVHAHLNRGKAPPLLTEPFITARELERHWPRAVVRDSLAGLAREEGGRLREVPGVGLVLILP